MRITRRRAALRHDLMGRIYHRLLADAKYFGAFYTTVPAAALLLKLTLDPSQGDVDWSNIDEIRDLRIADLACGTGTLLKAALQTIVDNHVHARAEKHQAPELKLMHQVLVENSLWGFDVIPFAIHLAASALAMHEPDARFGDMRLYTMPLGTGQPVKLGSLEFLLGRKHVVQADLYGSPTGPERTTGGGEVGNGSVEVPPLYLCVMNPPFTRSVGGNLLFGNAPRRQRAMMQARLRDIVRREEAVYANITAGLGSVFSALGHRLLKPGGHLALVLPRALLSGVAWEQTRQIIGTSYHVRYIIVSHEPGSWNFSENTKLSECLVVARRLRSLEKPGPTKVINLWLKPKTSIEALSLAELARRARGVRLDPDTGTEELRSDTVKFGEVILCPPERIRAKQWNKEAAFAQTELCRAAYHLARGQIYVPGRGCVGSVELTPLHKLGTVGPDRRDIHDGFRLSTGPTAYAAFWGHDTETIRCLKQDPNSYLSALARATRGRPLRDPNLLWLRSGRLMIAERLRVNTARVVSLRLSHRALSNTWWPIAVSEEGTLQAEGIECILALWLNSTLGILSLLAARVDTEGAWVDLKKPTLETLAVLNPSALTPARRRTLIHTCEDLADQELRQIPEINLDGVRARIDLAVMGSLGLTDDLSALRRMIAVEPLVIGARAIAAAPGVT
jgi:hypothetical protein